MLTAKCNHRHRDEWVIREGIIGIQYNEKDEPILILWNCPDCKSTLAVLWEKAWESFKARARQVELERRAG
jgi:hypothetical protein